jgi:hypothetical protein
MADERETELSDRFKAFLDAAHREPPLTAVERRKLRELIASQERWSWLRKKVFVIAPWLIAVLGGIGASWEHLMRYLGLQS